MTTDSTNILTQIQGFLSSIRKLAADTIQRDSVALLTDEVERRVQTLIQRYENAVEVIREERGESKKRNDEQIDLRKRIAVIIAEYSRPDDSASDLAEKINEELNK